MLEHLQWEYGNLNTCASAYGKKLKQDLDKARKEVKLYIDISFKYFQDLLDENLVQEWNQVVYKTCCTKGYVGQGGIWVPDKKQGFSFNSLDVCICVWLIKQKVPKDGTERV